MALIHAHVFSSLAVRRLAVGAEFPLRHPHPWLVWEPVVWKPSPLSALSAETLPASFSSRPPERPDGDALCFELAGPGPVKVGRAPDCDLRINDATVSREHLWLEQDAQGWRIRPGSETARTLLDGRPLNAEGSRIVPGAELRLGGVILHFEDPASLLRRLDAAAPRQ
ncbi:MAG: FHA domain-containing protein [Myxococcota bacterium]|nr:FHA domain-containing protein [Myxococcota bacterium]